ncbi:hypothetical protein BH09ACT3_BH09ACT3_03780 [soil metagenome]
MRGKLLLLVGLGVGYVLGTRAGREKYDQMKETVTKFWNDPRVQKQVKTAQDFAKDKAPEVVDFVTDSAKKVAAQVGPKPKTATTSSSAKTSTAK